MKVYIHPVLNEAEKDYFLTHVSNTLELTFNDGSHQFELCKDADIAIGNFNTDWIESMGNLRTILLDSVGIDNFNGYQWKESNLVSVHNLNDFFSTPVAEEVVASLLSVYRQLPSLKQAQQQSEWVKDSVRPTKRLLAEANVLLVGYGNIGKRIEQLLIPFGCQIATFDQAEMHQGGKQRLIETVADHDVIISTIPANAATESIFDQALFVAMRPGATFINVGRGQVVDEVALGDKAAADATFNACLDVTIQEPLNPASILWQLNNVHLTQHTGGGSTNENYKKIDIYISQINRLLSGQALINKIQF